MTERPILFSATMVRAILAGKKTQTRRAVRWPFTGQPRAEELDNLGDIQSLWVRGKPVPCPYGIQGDRLWVRETWAHSGADKRRALIYRADEGTAAMALQAPEFGRWRPAIHMPRTACRLRLEVTDMRAERLQDISIGDVDAEGLDAYSAANILTAANSIDPKPEHWINGYDEGISFCRPCAEKKIAELKAKAPAEEYTLDGGWRSPSETSSPPSSSSAPAPCSRRAGAGATCSGGSGTRPSRTPRSA
jgi:hypothetical protein